jgi:peroxiredoxin
VTIPEPQVAFFYFNGDRVTIFLSPNDSLIIRTDVYQFPVTVRFGGQAGANNSILQQYLRENPQDFNDFNNTRYKIGQWWVSVEEAASLLMEKLPPEEYQKNIAHKQVAAYTLLDEYRTDHPDALSQAFVEWLTMDIIYYRAFHLLVYGQVFARAHQVQPTFFEFMDETPFDHTMISNDTWRQYMMAYLAWRQIKADPAENFWVGEYKVAGELLTGKALACTRSEIIRSGFYGDQYRELLPIYTDFFQKNTYHEYEGKIADLYAKLGRMAPGAPAPPFEGRGQNGEPVTLSQFRGKIVYVNFWATWCAACLKKMEFFNEFEPELSQNGIQIVNISIDENAENWKNALAQRSFKGHNLLASSGTEKNIAQLYGVEAVPQYFIIDQNGNFVRKALSGQPNDIRLKLLEMNQK